MPSYETALIDLLEQIDKDDFLRDANFESHIVSQSLIFHQNNVAETLRALNNCAKWHKEVFGHQRKRVSIVHIHAFLLAETQTFVPNAKDREGRPISLRRTPKEAREIPIQHQANFVMWAYFWMMREGVKLKHFRPSLYKRLDEAKVCQPTHSTDSIAYIFNASKLTIKFWNAFLWIAKNAGFAKTHFIKTTELSSLIDVSLIPVDFGGLRLREYARADMEEFIREEYAREGLRYEPIDISTINWKTYKVPDVDLTLRPETAMSIASNMDFDEIDAQFEKM